MSQIPRNNNEVRDFISDLPDPILHLIISHLSVDEVFRANILSKRWINLWKYVLHLNFDCTRMVNLGKPSTYDLMVNDTLHQHNGDFISCSFKHLPHCLDFGVLNTWVESCVEKKKLSSLSLHCMKIGAIRRDYFKPNLFSNLNSLELTNYVLENSILPAFESCKKLKILKLEDISMIDSVINGILKFCFGLEKFSLIRSVGFQSLKIENKSLKILKLHYIYMLDSTINKILESCLDLEKLSLMWSFGFNSIKIETKSLKTLELIWLNVKEIDVNVEELQNLVIDSITCPPESFRIHSQNLRTFCSISESFAQRPKYTLKTKAILENCSDLFEFQSINIFRNLRTLSIDLNLNNIRETIVLSRVLKTCNCLNTLKISIPVNKASTSNDCSLPFHMPMFWENRETYFEFFKNLKFVTLKGFSGKEQEVLFANILITRAYRMEKMYVLCDSTIVDEAKDLLLLPRGSNCLSIILK